MTLVVISILVLAPASFAIKQLLPLHGRISSSGTALSTGDLEVTIWDANVNGNKVYDSNIDFNGTVIGGVVDVMLGSGTQTLDLNYGRYYFMDILVNGVDLDFNGVDRKQFESDRSGANSANTPAAGKLTVQGTGSGASTVTANFTNSSGTSLLLIRDSGNVGLGTTTPSNILNVVGDVNVGTSASAVPSLFINSTDGNVSLAATTSGSRLYVKGFGTTSASNNVNFVNSSGTSEFLVNDAGNVGIATTLPGNKLNVVGDLNVVTSASGTLAPSLFINSTDGNVSIAATTSGSRLYVKGFGTTSASNTANFVNSNGNSLLFVNDAGNLGVNNYGTAPAQVLDVNAGNTRLDFSSTGLGVNTTTPQNKLNVLGDLNVVVAAGTGSPLFYINATKAGFGTTVPGNAVTVVGDFNVATSNSAIPSLFINSTDGNVSLAATTSGARLYVQGYGTAFAGIGLNVANSSGTSLFAVRDSGDVNVNNTLRVQDVNSQNKIYRRETPTANACMGTATLASNGATLPSGVIVSTTCVTANSRVFLTRYGGGNSVVATAVAEYFTGERIAGTSFDINSTLAADTNSVAWMLVEPT